MNIRLIKGYMLLHLKIKMYSENILGWQNFGQKPILYFEHIQSF